VKVTGEARHQLGQLPRAAEGGKARFTGEGAALRWIAAIAAEESEKHCTVEGQSAGKAEGVWWHGDADVDWRVVSAWLSSCGLAR
jgi:hypothetical protein